MRCNIIIYSILMMINTLYSSDISTGTVITIGFIGVYDCLRHISNKIGENK